MTIPLTKAVEPGALTEAIKRLAPAFGGLTILPGTILLRRLAGDFSPQELALIQQAVDAHDAQAIQQARAARQAAKASERAKAPSSLTLEGRIRRLEVLMEFD